MSDTTYTRGIFRLKQVYDEQLSGNWSEKNDSWVTSYINSGIYENFLDKQEKTSTYGYYGSGHVQMPWLYPFPGTSTGSSNLYRINFFNDTSLNLDCANIPIRFSAAAISNSSNAYYGGGSLEGLPVFFNTSIFRISYSNDSIAQTTSASIIGLNPNMSAGIGNENYGYFLGAGTSAISRFDYSNDSLPSINRSTLTVSRSFCSGSGNQFYGYFFGGRSGGSDSSSIERLDYSNDTSSTTNRGNLYSSSNSGGSSNSTHGYFAGGVLTTPAPAPYTYTTASNIFRITFSNDSVVSSGNLSPLEVFSGKEDTSNDINHMRGLGSSSDAYFIDGINTYKLNYSNDSSGASYRTRHFQPTPLDSFVAFSAASNGFTATSSISNYKNPKPIYPFIYYWPGYGSSSNQARIINYNNDSVSTFSKGGDGRTGAWAASAGDNTYIWRGAGSSSSFFAFRLSSLTTTGTSGYKFPEKFDFSNSSSIPFTYETGNMVDSFRCVISSKSKIFLICGYWIGSTNYPFYNYGQSNRTNIIDAYNDSISFSTTVLNLFRFAATGSNNDNYGYIAGGAAKSGSSIFVYSDFYRIDFSSYTTGASNRGGLPAPSQSRAAMFSFGTKDYGYYGGGESFVPSYTGYSSVYRLDYSNDTMNTPVNAPVDINGFGAGGSSGASTVSYGYKIAGNTSQIHRLDYTNDTVFEGRGNVLSSTQYGSTASSQHMAATTTQ